LAEEKLIDITSIVGTGPGGRIILADVEKAIEEKKVTEVAPEEIYEGKRVAKTVPLEGMRKAIADLMYYSLTNSAQVTVAAEIDMTEMVRVRDALVSQAERIGSKVTYTDLFVFVLARVLKDNLIFNTSLIDGEIKFWQDINIGIAVSLGEQGLIVAVIKNADQKSIAQIALLSKELVNKARESKLRPDDVIGGTFTFSNIGMLSISRHQTPIIVPPQSAILAASAIKDTPVVREGQIVIRPMATFSLTYDHRIIDGEAGERFLLRFNELLQSPYLLSL
jgi:pyruvate dehydrogenase E2 component (dihydrolipoamide acetyltransferase)/2-oxoglutarate dehydrogenase E2 component (dihydrolipoamide succinyltransferase)